MKALRFSFVFSTIFFLSFTFTDLTKKSLLSGKVEILMPVDFDVMSKELLEIKYPSSRRPTLVYSNKDGSVNLAINHLPNLITENQLSEAMPVFVGQFSQLYPNMEWYNKEIRTINGKKYIIMEFISPAIDTSIYNLMFITELEGKMLMCSFNCTKELQSSWSSVAHEMMNSVKVN